MSEDRREPATGTKAQSPNQKQKESVPDAVANRPTNQPTKKPINAPHQTKGIVDRTATKEEGRRLVSNVGGAKRGPRAPALGERGQALQQKQKRGIVKTVKKKTKETRRT